MAVPVITEALCDPENRRFSYTLSKSSIEVLELSLDAPDSEGRKGSNWMTK